MTSLKSLKSAILTSVVAMLLSVLMLMGTTYAWFVEQEVYAGNTIASGTLDVELEKWDAKNGVWVNTKDTPILNYKNWEPGYTEVVNLRIVNNGSLAFTWNAMFKTQSQLTKLADVINVYVKIDHEHDTVKDYIYSIEDRSKFEALSKAGDDGSAAQFEKYSLKKLIAEWSVNPTKSGSSVGSEVPKEFVLEKGEAAYIGFVFQMDITAPIEYQNLNVCEDGGNFSFILTATQYSAEWDSFDQFYDKDAEVELPTKNGISTVDELVAAMAAGGAGNVVNDIDGVSAELAEGVEFSLNLNGHELSNIDGTETHVIVNRGTLDITGVTGTGEITANLKGSIENWGKLYVNDLKVNVKGDKYGFHCKDGTVEIDGMELRSERGGLNVQGGKVTVNDAQVTTTSYGTKIGYLVYAASLTSAEVVINDGKFTYEPGYYRHGVLYAGQNATIIVNGGEFSKGGSNTEKTKWLTEADDGDIIIRGGRFEFDPSGFVAEGYAVTQEADGWYTVASATSTVAETTETVEG